MPRAWPVLLPAALPPAVPCRLFAGTQLQLRPGPAVCGHALKKELDWIDENKLTPEARRILGQQAIELVTTKLAVSPGEDVLIAGGTSRCRTALQLLPTVAACAVHAAWAASNRYIVLCEV